MIALALSAALVASTLQPGGSSMSAGADTPPAASTAELQTWIDAQPEVHAYQQMTLTRGVRPPPADAFRRQPTLPREIACRSSRTAMDAAVRLFQASDGGKITLTDAAMTSDTAGRGEVSLNDQQKQQLQDQGRRFEQAAGEFEPACLG